MGSTVVCADVTETERQRRRLHSQAEQLDGFAAAVSHELWNTLLIAEGNVDVVADAVEAGERAVAMEAIEQVDEATERMTTIVGELATLAKLGQPAEALAPAPFEETVSRLWEAVGPPAVALVTDGDGTIETDEERLEELLRNVGQLAAATGATTVTATLSDGRLALTTDGDALGAGAGDGFFEYGMAVPTTTTGMVGPNIRTLARAQDWSVDLEGAYRDGIRLVVTGVCAEA